MTNNNRSEILQQSEISLDTGCLLCALCQPAQPPRTFADVQLSWHCAFRGTLQFLQLLASFRLCCVSRNRHHVRFQALKSHDTLHFVFLALSSTAGYLPSGLRQPSRPAGRDERSYIFQTPTPLLLRTLRLLLRNILKHRLRLLLTH